MGMHFEGSLGHYADEVQNIHTQHLASMRLPYEQGVDPASRVPGYITHGAEYHVFRLSDTYQVAKIAIYGWDYDKAREQDHHRNLIALDMCRNVPYLEQMIEGTATELPAIVTEFIPGTGVEKDIKNNGRQFMPDDFASLFAGFEALCKRDLSAELGGANVLYAERRGFTILDFSMADARIKPSIARSVCDFAAQEQLLASVEYDVQLTQNNLQAYMAAVYRRYGSAMADLVGDTVRGSFPDLPILNTVL